MSDPIVLIRRGRPETAFVSIANQLITNTAMTPLERLGHIYLLSRPPNWRLTIPDLRRVLGTTGKPLGRNKAYEVVAGLRRHRLVRAEQEVLEDGRFGSLVYFVFDEPEPLPEIRDAAPLPDLRDTVERDHIKERELQTTDLLSFDASERDERASQLAAVPASGFEEFWEAYPHKVGKASARAAFEKAKRKVSLADLLAGVGRYVASKPADRPWCNPSTFINQERWLDRPAAIPAAGSTRSGDKPQSLGERSAQLLREMARENGDGVQILR